jgi:protein adenylyltransferase
VETIWMDQVMGCLEAVLLRPDGPPVNHSIRALWCGVPVAPSYRPDPAILALGPEHADPVEPARFPQHQLRFRNQRWAERIGLGSLDAAEWEAAFARFEPLPGNLPQPLALRYHGVQFGSYNAGLGDGRGFLFAQLRDPAGRLLDLGTKGSGQTPYSRGFDGRLTLQGGVREILAAELLEALGVPTCKILSLYETGEPLRRNDEPSPARSAVMVRLGHSHIRIGSFQRLASLGELDGLRALTDFSARVYVRPSPEVGEPALHLMASVTALSAELCARWTAAGFVHGVLNSDNLNVTGESFDYGPWRSLPYYDPDFTAAYFDETGHYAFGRQPAAVLRNLRYLAESLAEIAPGGELIEILQAFPAIYAEARVAAVLDRLGLAAESPELDGELVDALLTFAGRTRVPWDQLWFDLRGGATRLDQALAGPQGAAYAGEAFARPRTLLEAHRPRPGATDHPFWRRLSPPSLVIDHVRALWSAIADRDDWTPLEDTIADLRTLGLALHATHPAPADC